MQASGYSRACQRPCCPSIDQLLPQMPACRTIPARLGCNLEYRMHLEVQVARRTSLMLWVDLIQNMLTRNASACDDDELRAAVCRRIDHHERYQVACHVSEVTRDGDLDELQRPRSRIPGHYQRKTRAPAPLDISLVRPCIRKRFRGIHLRSEHSSRVSGPLSEVT